MPGMPLRQFKVSRDQYEILICSVLAAYVANNVGGFCVYNY